MLHWIAIVEKEQGKAVGVWFPALPGRLPAGDTFDEAMRNAQEALGLWSEAMLESGQSIPAPRSLTDLKADPEISSDLQRSMVALIPFPEGIRSRAAE